MAIYPGARVRLLAGQYITGLPITSYNRVNLHVAAGLGSLFNFFNSPGKASSHFWVSKAGVVEQYVDTRLRAEADLHGNDATISIETESRGEGWTEEQIRAIIALVNWLCDTHGIPKRLATSSQLGEASKGISWHRLGIDGNFPALPSRYAGRRQRGGGMYYSKATGKTCPVEPNIDLIHDRVLPGVLGGAPVPSPVPVNNPVPAPAPAPSSRNPRPVGAAVQKGDTGPGVGEVQDILTRLGFYRGSRDNSAGGLTEEAILGFQFAAFGPSGEDGSFGPASRSAAAKVPPFPGYSIKGTTGEDTRQFQLRLRARGYSLDADGSHGPTTTRRITAFQSEKGLTADGNGGPQTWTALWVRPVT